MIDLETLAALVANILGGVGILAVVIFAAVAYLKQWGVAGKWLTASAFALGVVISLAVRWAMAPMQTPADWIWAVLFGLMGGFLATGAYKGGTNVAEKAKAKIDLGTPVEYADPDNLPDAPLYYDPKEVRA